jgi:hypothetical protein
MKYWEIIADNLCKAGRTNAWRENAHERHNKALAAASGKFTLAPRR